MVGLGENKDEIIQVMDDLRAADVDFLTIGQYLQPTIKHHAVIDYITPDLFDLYRDIAISKGFLLVSSSPFTRSSYHADEDFQKLKIKRNLYMYCLLYTSPSPRDLSTSRMPSSA